MKETQIVICERNIAGRVVYRIHYIAKEMLMNIKLVQETEKGLEQIIDWQDDEQLKAYITDESDVVIVSEEKELEIKNYLEKQLKNANKIFKSFIESMESGGELREFVELGGEYFGLVNGEGPVPLRLYHVLLGTKGKIRSYGPINEQSHFELLIMHEITQVADNSELFIQYNEGQYLGFQRKGDSVGIITIQYIVKEGEPFLSAAEDNVQFFKENEIGEYHNDSTKSDEEKDQFVREMGNEIVKQSK